MNPMSRLNRPKKMKFRILHEISGRLRIHILNKYAQSDFDRLVCALNSNRLIKHCRIYPATNDLMIEYSGSREEALRLLCRTAPETAVVPEHALTSVAAARKLKQEYTGKLVRKIAWRYIRRFLIPRYVRIVILAVKAVHYIIKALKCLSKGRLEVSVLDATAITVSLLRRDFKTAGSVMFLLEIGEILEDWTHKKSISDLAGSMSLNVGRVWLKTDEQPVLVKSSEIKADDEIIVNAGSMIPFDGTVSGGEAMVNQSTLTGEGVPVRRSVGATVYAGTVIEEGELVIRVTKNAGSTRYDKIVSMIEETEKLKSSAESKAEHIADKLVPFTFLGTALIWLLTRNVTKAMSVLMVDFSCALKLAMPVTVLSAIREANACGITVKGGKFLEKAAEANTIVFDKTGTLTEANPTVHSVVSFCDKSPDELLRIAACLEEHFPHSIANSVVRAAKEKNLIHDEMHTRVEYVVAHGVKSTIDGAEVLIGSYHFIFEDMGAAVPFGTEHRLLAISSEFSRLYLSIDGWLAAVICIEDPLREEASAVVTQLRELGFGNIVMMTGDSKHTAQAIAERVGVDRFYAEVLPEEKARFITTEKAKGNTVMMIGDGVNDSPALSSADVGIAISNGAAIAREIADITISENDLGSIVTLRKLSTAMMRRIGRNYRAILSVNGGLIALGVGGLAQPTTTAMLHNASTLGIGLFSTKKLL